MKNHSREFKKAGTLFLCTLILGAFTNCRPISKSNTGEQSLLSHSGLDCLSPASPLQYDLPTSIEETVYLINELPKPLTLGCFLASLKRPIKVFSMMSNFSAQASESLSNPRIFIINEKLVLSVVPKGLAEDALELSEFTIGALSVKGEIQFPIEQNISIGLPYSSIQQTTSTTVCSACHFNERVYNSGIGWTSFESNVIIPAEHTRQPVEQLKSYLETCDPTAEEHRCQILGGVFAFGTVVDGDFPNN